MQGRAEKVKDDLRIGSHCFFVEFVGEDLIEIIGFEFFIGIAVPEPYLGINAFDVLLLFLRLLFLQRFQA